MPEQCVSRDLYAFDDIDAAWLLVGLSEEEEGISFETRTRVRPPATAGRDGPRADGAHRITSFAVNIHYATQW